MNFDAQIGAALSQNWFAVHTSSCQEKRVALHLSNREIEHFLPVSRNSRKWKNGCTMLIEQPLFPGYLFVKIPRTDRVRVLELPGVHSIVSNGREPIALPGEEIERLREGIGQFNVEPCPYLNIGERARIIRGALQGMTGIIARKKKGLRLILSLDAIMKSISVEIDERDLEAIDSPCDTQAFVGTTSSSVSSMSF
jgi:transcription antitermination factor NusG